MTTTPSVWDDLDAFSEQNVYAERAIARGRELERRLSDACSLCHDFVNGWRSGEEIGKRNIDAILSILQPKEPTP